MLTTLTIRLIYAVILRYENVHSLNSSTVERQIMSDDKTKKVHDASGSGAAGSRRSLWWLWVLVVLVFLLVIIGMGYLDIRNGWDCFGLLPLNSDSGQAANAVPMDPVPEEPEVNPFQEELDEFKAENERLKAEIVQNMSEQAEEREAARCEALSFLDEDEINALGNEVFANHPDGCKSLHLWIALYGCFEEGTPEHATARYWDGVQTFRCTSRSIAETSLKAAQATLVNPPEGLLYTEAYREDIDRMLAELPEKWPEAQ